MKSLSLKIGGMSCGHCVARVQKALSGLAGVEVETVGVGSAKLVYDPEQVTPERIVEAVDRIGFEPQVAEAAV